VFLSASASSFEAKHKNLLHDTFFILIFDNVNQIMLQSCKFFLVRVDIKNPFRLSLPRNLQSAQIMSGIFRHPFLCVICGESVFMFGNIANLDE